LENLTGSGVYGRPERRWEDNTKMNVKEIVYKDGD
jgi:hypothetical protein